VRANSGEISGELQSRVLYGAPIDGDKPDPVLVTPAADHWVVDLNHALGREVLDGSGAQPLATTFIGIVTSREMAQCLGWPGKEIGFADVIELASDPSGWSRYECAKPEWGREALLAFTYPSRSSTARSVLYTLYSIAADKPAETLTLGDISSPAVVKYVNRFQSAVDCYVPDTLDLNSKILSAPSCAHFFFIAEDNLVKLYQGKLSIPIGSTNVTRSLDRDLVMIYPKEGAIIHNHSAFVINADFVSSEQAQAARSWIEFLREEPQQRAFMQEGFRRVTPGPCVDPVGSPFSPCGRTPSHPIYPDRIDPAVAAAILDEWE
jgi:Ca-activated chloride channel family protein